MFAKSLKVSLPLQNYCPLSLNFTPNHNHFKTKSMNEQKCNSLLTMASCLTLKLLPLYVP